jgi:hypothetical protein
MHLIQLIYCRKKKSLESYQSVVTIFSFYFSSQKGLKFIQNVVVLTLAGGAGHDSEHAGQKAVSAGCQGLQPGSSHP